MSRPMGGEERGILPLCNIEKFFASHGLLDIFRVAAAADRLASPAKGQRFAVATLAATAARIDSFSAK